MINHIGKVLAVGEGEIFVSVERGEACGKCENKKSCAMLVSSDQTVKIKDIDFQNYTVGEMVTVSLKTSLGLKAVLLAYVLPLVVLLLSLVVGFQCFASELLQVATALIPTVIYYIILYGFRNRIEKEFKLSISKR